LKENSKEIEYLLWGKSPIPSPDLPMEELPTWAAINSRDPQHTPDWDTEERFPRFKEYAKKIKLGSSIRVPLITPHRRLGVFGIIRDLVNPFTDEEIDLLRLIGRVVAFALDDGIIVRVHPNFAVDQILVLRFWNDGQHVRRSRLKSLPSQHLKLGVYRRLPQNRRQNTP
jgi:hypothetical protein